MLAVVSVSGIGHMDSLRRIQLFNISLALIFNNFLILILLLAGYGGGGSDGTDPVRLTTDTAPNQFDFVDQSDVALSGLITSNDLRDRAG